MSRKRMKLYKTSFVPLPTEITLDNKRAARVKKNANIIGRIIAGIQADKKRFIFE